MLNFGGVRGSGHPGATAPTCSPSGPPAISLTRAGTGREAGNDMQRVGERSGRESPLPLTLCLLRPLSATISFSLSLGKSLSLCLKFPICEMGDEAPPGNSTGVGCHCLLPRASQVVLIIKNLPANTGDIRDAGLIPGSGRSLEEGMATHSSILAPPWTCTISSLFPVVN